MKANKHKHAGTLELRVGGCVSGHSDRMFARGLGSLFVGALEFIVGSHFADKLHAGYTVSLDDLNDLRATCNVTGFW